MSTYGRPRSTFSCPCRHCFGNCLNTFGVSLALAARLTLAHRTALRRACTGRVVFMRLPYMPYAGKSIPNYNPLKVRRGPGSPCSPGVRCPQAHSDAGPACGAKALRLRHFRPSSTLSCERLLAAILLGDQRIRTRRSVTWGHASLEPPAGRVLNPATGGESRLTGHPHAVTGSLN